MVSLFFTEAGIVIVDNEPSSGGSVSSFSYDQPSFFRNVFQGKVDRYMLDNNDYTWQNRWCEINKNIFYCYIRERDSISCEFHLPLSHCRTEIIDFTSKGRPHAFKLIWSEDEEIAIFAQDTHEAVQSIVRIIKHASEVCLTIIYSFLILCNLSLL